MLFIYLILFKKKEKKSKTWPLTTNKKKNYGSVIFCKASFIFNWHLYLLEAPSGCIDVYNSHIRTSGYLIIHLGEDRRNPLDFT
jgi:hypothetical protein